MKAQNKVSKETDAWMPPSFSHRERKSLFCKQILELVRTLLFWSLVCPEKINVGGSIDNCQNGLGLLCCTVLSSW